MSCINVQLDEKVLKKPNKILLMGNPNVGKSVFFTELTGVHAISSNYAGTTVSYMEGSLKLNNGQFTLIDVPGTYSLTPTSEAEAVAASFLKSGALAVICVLDASNLERNLSLALELKQSNVPIVYALNLIDVAERGGITINEKLLEQELQAPVVPAIAVKKQGIEQLVKQLETILEKTGANESISNSANDDACPPKQINKQTEIWPAAKEITRRVSAKKDLKQNFLDKLGENMVKPFPGLPIALVVLALLVVVVRFGGGGLRSPLIMLTDGLIIPFFRNLFESIFAFFAAEGANISYNFLYYDGGFQRGLRMLIDGAFQEVDAGVYAAATGFASILLNVLIGEHGIFVISFQWILALILPYVFAFYAAITFLEDSGYLPRLSVLFDNIMRKLGIQGGSLIHVFLALGCAIPAIIGSRTAATRKERLIIAAIICFTIPCISQLGALIALLTADGFAWWLAPLMLLFALVLFVSTALIAGKLIKGRVEPLIIEVPNLLMPEPKAYFKKLMVRMRHFMLDAELPMLAAVFLAALLAGTGVIGIIAKSAAVQSVVGDWLGMPEDAVIALILGIVRREMSVAPLLVLNLSHLQAFVAGVVSLLYLPCLSVTGILAKEFKLRTAVIIFFGTIISAILIGGLINQIVRFFI